MFIREKDRAKLADFKPDFTVFDCPLFQADPTSDGTTSPTVIAVNFEQHLVLIGGTRYAGEIKKSIFSALNFYLPQQDVMPMHCSANYGVDRDDVAVFFGLSGTGKTTLSADSSRTLIGDDEHGWSDHGVFNFEGGCYAKTIKITADSEPEIYATTKRMGSILENVVLDEMSREPDFFDSKYTQNTRVSYPIEFIPNADSAGMGGHPKNVLFLTADAFGVLPPISKLTRAQTQYHFLNGYTAKVAGTERGVTEPEATFSTCFGAPFMPMHPSIYANMLGNRVEQHGVNVWLINTGWTGGSYGTGKRMHLSHTRRMVSAALAGELDDVETVQDPFFGLAVPTAIAGVPSNVLMPRDSWEDEEAYNTTAQKLLDMFEANYRQYSGAAQ
jgi:phosphoenolpyruvate carboxykinase (ATP)